MELSITTDYLSDAGCPEDSLRAIAEAGFTHVHWCHQWNTDFLYGTAEIRQIEKWLREMGIKLLDLHGSAGKEKCWWSSREYERRAGVELIRNRVRMTARLGGASVVMHVPTLADGVESSAECDQVRRSIDELEGELRKCGVRLAIENMGNDRFHSIELLLGEHGEDVLGVCYDSGHGNIGDRGGLERVEKVKSRLIALHLHDNDGQSDLHWPPFAGTVDFGRLAGVIATSGYRGCISMESNTHKVPEEKRPGFLREMYAAGRRLSEMVATARGA